MNWQEYYKLPLKVDEDCTIITWDANNRRAFDWLINGTLEQKERVVDLINGSNSNKKLKNQFYREGVHIYSKSPALKDVPILRIRGWGYLTGVGGCHLDHEIAAQIQDAFGDYIVEQLNKNVLIT